MEQKLRFGPELFPPPPGDQISLVLLVSWNSELFIYSYLAILLFQENLKNSSQWCEHSQVYKLSLSLLLPQKVLRQGRHWRNKKERLWQETAGDKEMLPVSGFSHSQLLSASWSQPRHGSSSSINNTCFPQLSGYETWRNLPQQY